MAGLSSGVIGIAAAMAFGAAFHFEQAVGSEARGVMAMLRSDSSVPYRGHRDALDHGVNRAAKSDRLVAPQPAVSYRTMMVTLVDLADTSVVMRILVADAGSSRAPAKPPRGTLKPDDTAKPLVACEPVASILTEAASVIGRCLA